MALAKKGTRLINIDGTAYRWAVSPDDGFMVLVAELARRPGRRLEAFFRYHDIYEPDGPGALRIVGQRRSIGPRAVRTVVLAALVRGWQPAARGRGPYRICDAETLVPVGT
jgi:hypothetical protein